MPILKLPDAEKQSLTVRAKALVFEDARSRALLDRVEQVAPSDATVLITGETGTGKEILARHIHHRSPRAAKPFVAINCGAFSETLVESELFGHDKGAFTGATTAKAGWFEAADGGTLFLDEIGDLPAPVQVKLLRVLQEREVVRLGSRTATHIDVRLVAATNVHLERAVASGRFREDLYFRLNVATVHIPPLRERLGDIVPLANYFLSLYTHRMGVPNVSLAVDAQARLLEHSWPGNIRELENAMHQALLVCQHNAIAAADLRLTIMPPRSSGGAAQLPTTPGMRAVPDSALGTPTAAPSLEEALLALFEQGQNDLHQHIDATVIRTAYRFCDRNQLQTARLLGISRNIVRARLLQYGVLAGAPRQTGARPQAAALSEDDAGDSDEGDPAAAGSKAGYLLR